MKRFNTIESFREKISHVVLSHTIWIKINRFAQSRCWRMSQKKCSVMKRTLKNAVSAGQQNIRYILPIELVTAKRNATLFARVREENCTTIAAV